MRIVLLVAGAAAFVLSFGLTLLIMDHQGRAPLGPNVRLITSLPAIIDQAGEYALGTNLDAAKLPAQPPEVGLQVPAISIMADGVSLQGNGYSLTNSAGLANRGVGVYALNRSNIVIERMTIRGNGIWYPIYLQDDRGYKSGRHTIRQNRLSGTFRGARIEGSDNTITLNEIADVGGQTSAPTGNVVALELFGNRSVTTDNQIRNLRPLPGMVAIGVSLSNCDGAVVRGNAISNAEKPANSIGLSVGDRCHQVVIERNVLTRWNQCIVALDGQPADLSGASGRMTGNELVACDNPLASFRNWKVEAKPQ